MNRSILHQYGLYILLVIILSLGGCKGGNIFGFRDASNDDVGDLFRKGQKQLRDGEFAEAQASFARAIEIDGMNSEVRFFHAQATLLLLDQQVSIVSLIKEVTSDIKTKPIGTKLPLYSPRHGSRTPEDDAEKDLIYTTNITIINDLNPIAEGQTFGRFDSSSVALDLAIANMVRAILSLRDTNRDLRINAKDFFFDISKLNTNEFSLEGFHEFVLTPEDVANFNQILEDFGIDAESIIGRVLDNIDLFEIGRSIDDTSINIDDLKSIAKDLQDSALQYFILDPDNPNPFSLGDNDLDRILNEEILDGLDNDGDGRIDEDSIFILRR